MRLNTKNDFENVYLRSKTIQKYMPLADPNILNDKEFISVVNYLARTHFNKHTKMWCAVGFELDDLRSLAQIWGLTFSGMGVKADTPRGYYLIMSNFISQRMNGLKEWVYHKFKKDTLSMRYYDDLSELDQIDTSSTDHLIQEQFNIVDLIDMKIENNDIPNKESSKLRKVQKKAYAKLSELKQVKHEAIVSRKQTTDRLKKQFQQNPVVYSDKLLYYANSESDEEGLRHSARLMCSRYGIHRE